MEKRPSYLRMNDRYMAGEKIWLARTLEDAAKQFMKYRNGKGRERYEVVGEVLTIYTLKNRKRVFSEENTMTHRYIIVEVGFKDRTVGRPEMKIFQMDAVL